MNMMIAKIEKAALGSWEEQTQGFPEIDDRISFHLFCMGFAAGVAWTASQVEIEGLSQPAGTMSHYPAAAEEPEEEA